MQTESKKPVIGVIGLGNMGSRIAANILSLGYKLMAYDMSVDALRQTSSIGAIPCKSSFEVASRSNIIMTVLPSSNAVRSAVFDAEGILNGVKGRTGKTLLEMSSTDSTIIREVSSRLGQENCKVLSVTIHGVDEDVERRDILLDIAGERKVADYVSPILQKLSRAIVYVGEDPGASKDMKTAAAMLSAVTILGTAEVLSWVVKKGLDPNDFVKIMENTPSHLSMVEGTKRMLSGGFQKRTSWMSKDVGFGLKEAEAMNLSMPLASSAQQVFLVGKAHGFDHYDTRGMASKTYEVLTGVKTTVNELASNEK